MESFNAALVQAEPELGDKRANLKKMGKLVKETKADLYIFGELYLTGYMCKDLFFRLGEDLGGPSVKEASRIAEEADATIIFGMPEKDRDTGAVYNSSVHISRSDEPVSYRKLYPANFGPFEELEYFRQGHELKVVDNALGKIGLLICYDTFFPEVTKGLALGGAQVLVCISAAPASSKPFFDQVIPARAIETTCFFLYSNLVGTELNMVFQGGTQAIGPRGEELCRASDFEEEVIRCTVNLGDIDVAKRFRPTLRDTRPEVIRLLLEASGDASQIAPGDPQPD